MATPIVTGRTPMPIVPRSAAMREPTDEPSPNITITTQDTTRTALPAASHFSCVRRTPDDDRHAATWRQTNAIQAAEEERSEYPARACDRPSDVVREGSANVDDDPPGHAVDRLPRERKNHEKDRCARVDVEEPPPRPRQAPVREQDDSRQGEDDRE